MRDLLPPAVLAAAAAETVFWSGAGISADAPTCAPIGTALAERALGHAFAPGTAGTLERYYRRLRLKRRRPRLETLLDVVNRIHGEDALFDLLSDLEAPPNPLHGFFAAHLLAGGDHITANFDTCIERATGRPVDVVHFHGSLFSGELGATLARIERGLPPDQRNDVLRVLLSSDKRLIVFVGYSGSDFFDVDPLLRTLPGDALRGRDVVWVDHDDPPPRVVPAAHRQVEWLEEAGATVTEIAAPTADVIATFADAWSLPLRRASGAALTWTPTIAIADASKERATFELFAAMGLHGEVIARARPTTAREWEALGHTLWARARYREAGRAWQRGRAQASEAAQIERAAAVLWIRGQYRKAVRLLVDAVPCAAGSEEERLLLAETLARVLDHMDRYPDSRRWTTPELRAFVLDYLPDPDELARRATPVGTHLRARLRSARRAVGATVAVDDDDDAITAFGEYEALSAQLNYRHGQLRQQRKSGRVDPLQFQLLRRDFETIGNLDSAARTVLLGGRAAFSWREIIAAVFALDVTPWHGLRLLLTAYLQPQGAR